MQPSYLETCLSGRALTPNRGRNPGFSIVPVGIMLWGLKAIFNFRLYYYTWKLTIVVTFQFSASSLRASAALLVFIQACHPEFFPGDQRCMCIVRT